MNISLARQTALVTGASSGIGQAVAIALANAGANIVVNYHSDEEGAAATLNAVTQAGKKGIIYKADIGQEEEVLAMFAAATREFGTLDILVNNAGIQRDGKFSELSLEDWMAVINTNLTGQFLCAREAAKEFSSRGKTEYSKALGKILFISSVHNIIPWAGHVNYAASKGGETMLMESIAQELAPQGIRVNSIAPGAIKTDINKSVWSDPVQRKKLMELIPYGRIGEPEDIGKAAVWLASDEADYITGATIYVDGGMTLYPSFASGG
ncbi:MAG: SDR family oxidoreductase [Bacteroidetes bacterium]|nr:SDR family oxidoreductase [Bacteroidota bacterium]